MIFFMILIFRLNVSHLKNNEYKYKVLNRITLKLCKK